jgi:multidrug transporter EmrE-like cation transporter
MQSLRCSCTFLFGETLVIKQIGGIALIMGGVVLINQA